MDLTKAPQSLSKTIPSETIAKELGKLVGRKFELTLKARTDTKIKKPGVKSHGRYIIFVNS